MPEEHPTPVVPPDEIPKECPECHGDELCPECHGTGLVALEDDDQVAEQSCDACTANTGKCDACKGAGHVTNANYVVWLLRDLDSG